MLAKTAIAELPNTRSNNSSESGEFSMDGTADPTKMINNEKIEAKIPAITI